VPHPRLGEATITMGTVARSLRPAPAEPMVPDG